MSELPRLPDVEPDSLPVETVKAHALEKYRRVSYYDMMFARGMKNRWDELFYVDLFSGPGRARVEAGPLVPTSPMLALNIPDRFTRYVYCEENPDYISALEQRVRDFAPNIDARFIEGDVNQNVDEILENLTWRPGKTALTFVFADPYSIDLPFETIRRIAESRLADFLILVATGMDAKRNFNATYLDPDNHHIDRFLGRSDWREEFYESEEEAVYFLLRMYSENMEDLGYLPSPPEKVIPVRHHTKRFPLYHLAYFSQDRRGWDFYEKMKAGTADQGELDLGTA